jgi:2-keto-4-pentenoate hydratase
MVEPEVGIEVADDGASAAALMPALEIVAPDSLDDLEQVLAGNVFHRGVVLGPRSPVASPGTARVLHDGEQLHQLDASGALAGILDLVARRLADAGERLRPGDVVIAGTLTPPLAVAPGSSVRLELDPIGAVDVSFAP